MELKFVANKTKWIEEFDERQDPKKTIHIITYRKICKLR